MREGWASESQWVVGSIRDQGDMRAVRKSDGGVRGISRLAENTAARCGVKEEVQKCADTTLNRINFFVCGVNAGRAALNLRPPESSFNFYSVYTANATSRGSLKLTQYISFVGATERTR